MTIRRGKQGYRRHDAAATRDCRHRRSASPRLPLMCRQPHGSLPAQTDPTITWLDSAQPSRPAGPRPPRLPSIAPPPHPGYMHHHLGLSHLLRCLDPSKASGARARGCRRRGWPRAQQGGQAPPHRTPHLKPLLNPNDVVTAPATKLEGVTSLPPLGWRTFMLASWTNEDVNLSCDTLTSGMST